MYVSVYDGDKERIRGRKIWLAEKCLQVVNDGWLDRFLAKITFCCEITGNVGRSNL